MNILNNAFITDTNSKVGHIPKNELPKEKNTQITQDTNQINLNDDLDSQLIFLLMKGGMQVAI